MHTPVNTPRDPYLSVNDVIRLRPVNLDRDPELALPWYQDMDVLKYTADIARTTPYDLGTVKGMYRYLSSIGECYIIEWLDENGWLPVGDVTLAEDTIPIVIGRKELWGRGIARSVLSFLIQRAREKGFTQIRVAEIYHFNSRSLNLFRSLGFKDVRQTDDGIAMVLSLLD